jgi:predicted TPR repeat methyltransferase
MNSLSYANLFESLLGNFKADFECIRHALTLAPVGPVVEFGAGSGRTLDVYGNRDTYLVESDPQMIAILRQKILSYPNVKLVPGSALKVPLPDDHAAAVVLAANTLSEMRPALFVLAEAKRILRDDGVIHMVVTNPKCLGRQPQGLRSGLKRTGRDLCYSYDLRRDPIRGNGAYIMEMLARSKEGEGHYEIRQTLPEIGYWLEIFEVLGLKPNEILGSFQGGIFDETMSEVAIFNLVKSENTHLPAQPVLQAKFNEMATSYDSKMIIAKYQGPIWLEKVLLRYKGCSLNVLDLGCGTGTVGKTLLENDISAQIFGLDFSSEMVATCKKPGTYTGVVQADLSYGIPIHEEMQFDLITMLGVMEFISDQKVVLDKIRRLLVYGGEAWMTFEIKNGKIDESRSLPGVKKYSRSESEVNNLLEASGLELISMETGFGHRSFAYDQDIEYLFVRTRRIRDL